VEATGLGAAELPEGEAAGDVALGLPAAEEVSVGRAAVDGAPSRATVAATGSDEGVRLHFPASAVPWCSKRVAAAT
jgi:hypothetical protein